MAREEEKKKATNKPLEKVYVNGWWDNCHKQKERLLKQKVLLYRAAKDQKL